MRLIVLLLSVAVAVHGVEADERERLRADLIRVRAELTDAQERFVAALAGGGVLLPAGVQTTLAARRTLGDDWLRRLADPAADFPVEEADGFREGLEGLRQRLENVIGLIGQSASAADNWPQAVATPEFTRYRDFLRRRIDQLLLEAAAGAEHPEDEEMFWRRQRRHELVLNLGVAAGQVAERWPLVSKDAPVLREYLALSAALRAAAEVGLQHGNPTADHELDRDEGVLGLLDESLNLAQEHAQRLHEREFPADAALLPAYQAAHAAEEQSLRALIAHRRATIGDEPERHRQEQALRQARDQRYRLTALAWEGVELELSLIDRRRHLAELLMEVPPALQAQATERATAFAQQRATATTGLTKALAAGARVDALHARTALRILLREVEAFIEEFEQARERLVDEQEWRARAGEPGVAAALGRLDAAWNALAAARTRQMEADHAAIRSELARELAEVEAEAAGQAAEQSRHEMDRAREALDLSRQQVVDALENPQPKPEGDAKF